MRLKPLIPLLLMLLALAAFPAHQARAQQVYRIYVIPVEFPDFPAYFYVDEVLEPIYEFADSYIPEISYHRAEVQVDYYPDWIMLDKSYAYYNSGEKAEELVRDALMALPEGESLEGYDVIVVLHAGDDEYISELEEDIKSASSFGSQVLQYSGGTIVAGWALLAELDWTAQVAHHILHALGVPEAFSDGEDYADGWDPMGLTYTQVDYPVHVNIATKIQMGWVYENETYVLTSGRAVVDLMGSAFNREGYKAIILPISGSESYIIEARTFFGYDWDIPDEGVLIWHKTRDGVRLVDVRPETPRLDDANLQEGDVFEDPEKGVRVEVLSYCALCSIGVDGYVVKVEFSPGIIVDQAIAPAGRLNLGEEARVLFHAYRAFDGLPAEGYTAVVMGQEATFNSTGWAEFSFTSDEPVSLEVGIDEIRYEGESLAFTFSAPVPVLTWDRVVVESVEVDRPVADVGYEPEVRVYAYYESDHTPLSNGEVVVNGTRLEFQGEYWYAKMPASQQVGRVRYCVESVEDLEYNLTSVEYLDRCAEFSWDRVVVDVGDWYGDISTPAAVDVEARYELSGLPFQGDVYVNGTEAELVEPGRYRLEVPPPARVGSASLEVTGIVDYDYNITAFTSSSGTATWDAVRVTRFEASERWADVGEPVRLEAELAYELSGLPFQGDVYVNGTKMVMTAPGEYYMEVKEDEAGTKTFTITGIGGNVTTLVSTPAVEVTWDRVLVTLEAVKETYEPGQEIGIGYKAVYESDGSPFKGTVEFNLPLVQDEPGTYEYTVKAVHDEERGITAFKSNSVVITVVQPEKPPAEEPQQPPEQPQDMTIIWMGLAAALLAIVGIVVVLVKRR